VTVGARVAVGVGVGVGVIGVRVTVGLGAPSGAEVTVGAEVSVGLAALDVSDGGATDRDVSRDKDGDREGRTGPLPPQDASMNAAAANATSIIGLECDLPARRRAGCRPGMAFTSGDEVETSV
jgi:hypothetical protein